MTSSATGLTGHNPIIPHDWRDRSARIMWYDCTIQRDRYVRSIRKNPEKRPYQNDWYGRYLCAYRKNPEIRHDLPQPARAAGPGEPEPL